MLFLFGGCSYVETARSKFNSWVLKEEISEDGEEEIIIEEDEEVEVREAQAIDDPEVPDRVFFKLSDSKVKKEDMNIVKKQASFMKQYPDYQFIIEGHCDERGARHFNMGLGERRGNALRSALIQQGIGESRLEVVSYGKERPAVLGHNEKTWKQNRRAVIVIK